MTLAVIQHRAQDANGNLITGVDLRVRNELTALSLATLYADRAAAVTIGNPTTGGYFSDGKIKAYVEEGTYRIDLLVDGVVTDTFFDVAVLSGASGFFIQAGTGAVTRTTQDKARESLSVLDFGAVPDDAGVDNKAAFEAAFEEQAASGKTLRIPGGTWYFSTLVYPGHLTAFHFNQGCICGEGGSTILKQLTANAGDDLWTFNDVGINAVADLIVKDIAITCQINKTAGRGMFFDGCARVTLDGILMRGDFAMYDAIEFNGCASMVMRNCKIFSCARDGIVAYSDGVTGSGAGLFIDETNLVLSPGRDGLSIRGGMGGVHCELHVYTAGRYGCFVTRDIADGGTDVRNRDITFSNNCSFDGTINDAIYFDTASVEMVKVQGGWYNSPVGGGSGAAFQINVQGPGESSGYSGLAPSFHFEGVTARQGNGPGIAWEDGGELKVNACDFSFRTTGAAGIFISPPAGTGIVEITNNKIVGSGGYALQSDSYPERCCITGNMLYDCVSGALLGVPSAPDANWIGVIANNVIT